MSIEKYQALIKAILVKCGIVNFSEGGGSRDFIASLLDSIQELESKLDFFANSAMAKHDFATIKINESAKHNLESVVGVGDIQGGGSDFAIQAPPPCEKEKIESSRDASHSKPFSMTNTNDLKALLDSIPTPPAQGWKVEKISQIVEKLSAGGDKPKVFSESKTQECQVPIYANAVEKQGLYGYTDKPTITQNALTISARGTIGYAVARYEPFCPIVRLIVLIPKANKANLKFLEVVINNIEIEQSGVNIPQLTVPQFSNLKIPLPPLEAQEKIVSAIDSVESQIAYIDSKLEILEKRKAEILANALNAGNERERERENRQSLKKS